jgi:hypothetical protein
LEEDINTVEAWSSSEEARKKGIGPLGSEK